MRLILAILIVTTGMSFVPAAAAHACSGTQANCVCPVPNDGQMHSHAGPSGSCTNGAEATPGGASAPGAGTLGAIVAIGVALLAIRRRA